ncbi:MAG: hypothetical protein ACO28P_01425 [Ilumatobacteraceae bacterium]
MSTDAVVAQDEQQDADVAVEATGGAEDTGADAKVFDEEYVKKLRSENAKYRTQAKELAEKAKAYDEYTASQKTEAEKQAEALEAATRERDTLKQEMLRLRVAQEKNLPKSLIDRLRGDTEEEMMADADALLEGISSVAKPKPSPQATGAGVVGDADAPSDPATLAARVTAHNR